MTTHIDLAEFVSDYYQMLRDNEERIPPKKKLAEEIAKQYLDAMDSEDEVTEGLIANINYYLS